MTCLVFDIPVRIGPLGNPIEDGPCVGIAYSKVTKVVCDPCLYQYQCDPAVKVHSAAPAPSNKVCEAPNHKEAT